ncbi:MAG: CMP/dCMP deaminase zinc-binding protein [Candidatus Nomurabacteria bacterium]|nr:CMP/dCMP deaminase zinc-binding protein [Candidatus Nomurabacteria bacterium]
MNEEQYMQLAIDEATKAAWPFGAVIVKDGEIIAQAGSGDGQDETHDPTAHAEVNAIRRASLKLKGDLKGATLYASCEPCALCFGASWYAGIRNIVYGSSIKDLQEIDYLKDGDLVFPHEHVSESDVEVKTGVLRDKVMDMYKSHSKAKQWL